jgi:hypothetical protein
MRPSTVLRRAKVLIARTQQEDNHGITCAETGKHEHRQKYICHAIDELEYDGTIGCCLADKVKAAVQARIKGFYTVDEWVKAHPVIGETARFLNLADYNAYFSRVQDVRLHPVDHMIAECEAAGN